MSKVGVIVLQYNHSEATFQCVKSILASDYHNFFVVLVDNNSETKHRETIESLTSEKVKIIYNEENLGYAGGNNIGINYAFENGADYVLILNNDTIIDKNLISELIKSSKEDTILGTPIRESERIIYGGSYKWLNFEGKHLAQPEPISPPRTYLVGACLFFGKKLWKNVGPISEKYFLYFEDIDFCTQAMAKGYKLEVIKSAYIRHSISTSTKSLGNPMLFYLHYRNALIFQWQYAPFYIKIILPFYIIWILIYFLLRLVRSKDNKITEAMFYGVMDFIKGKYGKSDYKF